MTREDRQEALSLAYIHAVAAMFGMTHSRRSKDYGIDLTLHEVQEEKKRYLESGVSLDIQVKSTTSASEARTKVSFDLPIRAYNILRIEADQARILALFVFPTDETQWLRQSHSKLELRKCVIGSRCTAGRPCGTARRSASPSQNANSLPSKHCVK